MLYSRETEEAERRLARTILARSLACLLARSFVRSFVRSPNERPTDRKNGTFGRSVALKYISKFVSKFFPQLNDSFVGTLFISYADSLVCSFLRVLSFVSFSGLKLAQLSVGSENPAKQLSIGASISAKMSFLFGYSEKKLTSNRDLAIARNSRNGCRSRFSLRNAVQFATQTPKNSGKPAVKPQFRHICTERLNN